MIRRTIAVAVTSLLVSTAVPRRAEANPMAVPVVAACFASVTCGVAVVVIGGIAYWTISEANRPQEQVYIGPVMPMLDDPEAEVTQWEDYVWARDDRSARQKCEAIAEAKRLAGEPTRLLRVIRRGQNRFECVFQGEG